MPKVTQAQAREAAKLLGLSQKKVKKKCLHCKKTMIRVKRAKFCGNRCRQANKYAKERGRAHV